MRAVILAGGLGTRLQPYTTILPKALVPVGHRPILEDIIHRLASADVRDIDLCVGHLGQLIQVYFSQATDLPTGLNLRWHWEHEPLGTAGALKVVPGLDETFIAMNGDVLTKLDYRELIDHHRASGATMTIAMQAKSVDIDLGVIEHKSGFLTGYREKPKLHYDVSMGIYVYEPRALQFIPDGVCQFPDLVHLLLEAGEPVAAYPTDVEWYDIGTVAEHERAMHSFSEWQENPEGSAPPPPDSMGRITGQ
jgi:NDP-mannose synthase